MTRSKKLLLVGVPLIFLVAWLYPLVPWHNLGLCAVNRMLGLKCPGCGFIRSVVALAHGEFKTSATLHPMGIVAMVILSSLWLKEFVVSPVLGREIKISPQVIKIVSIVFVAGLFIQWFFYLAIKFKAATAF